MTTEDVVAELKDRIENLLVNPPRPVDWAEPFEDLIDSESFTMVLEWIDDAVENLTGAPFHTPDEAAEFLGNLAEVRKYILSVTSERA